MKPFEIKEGILRGAIAGAIFFLVVRALWELSVNVLDYDQYQAMFSWMVPSDIFLRYSSSILWRSAFILAAVLTLLRKDIGRKVLVIISLLTILSLPWKHPYQAFVNVNLYFKLNLNELAWVAPVPWSAGDFFCPAMLMRMINCWIQDFVVSGLTVFVLIIPRVRALFH